MAADPEDASKPIATRRPPAWRRTWLSPGGISGIAAVVALFIGLATLMVQLREPPPTQGAPLVSVTPSAERAALFVYGSSMPGMSRYDAVSRYVAGSVRDSVDGLLFDSGLGYPLAKFGPGGEVRGFVLWLDPATADAAMAEMTRVEAGLFHPVKVRTRSGITAQAFEWIGPTDDLPRIDVWDGTTAQFGQDVAWLDLQEGECFQATDDERTVLLVWCEAPHQYEVSFSGTVKRTGAGARETAEAACDDAHRAYIGRPQSESRLAVRVFDAPVNAKGEVPVLCGVGEAGQLVRGSLRQSDR